MRIAVYLGSHDGKDPIYCETAFALGRRLAIEGIEVVYGGSRLGTMGALARGIASEGGECIGVFPKGFKGRPDIAASGIDIRQEGLKNVIIAKDFAERKKVMEDMSDCCVALPGSWGTMEELFTYTTSTQLLINGGKRLFVLNVNGFYDHLHAQIERMFEDGFIDPSCRSLITFVDSIDELIAQIR